MTEPVTLRLVGENGQLLGVLRTSREGLKGLGDETKKTDETVRRTMPAWAKEAGKTKSSFDMLNGSARDLAKTMIAGLGFASVAAGIQNAIVEATSFNREIAKISTALSDTSKLQGYADELRKMAREFGLGAKSQAASLYEIISAGQDAATAMLTLTAANKLAVGGLTTVETAADGLTSVMNAYASSSLTAAQASDVLFVGAAAGKTNIEQLSNSLGLVANTASTVGVEFDELVGSISTITLSGVQTSVAVTQMRAALNSIIKPSSEANELAEKLGLNFSVAAVKTKGWSGFLEELSEKTDNNISTLATLFGSTEAVSGILSVTGDNAGKFAGVMDLMATSAGATDIAFKKMADTADFQFKRATVAANELAIQLGQKLLIALAPLAEAFADNIDTIGSAIETTLKVTVAYVAIFKVVPAVYATATTAGWNFVAMLTAQRAGMLASIQSIGLLKLAGGALFAAFAGWEIGTWLRDNFVEARIAGVYMIESLMKGWEHLKAAGSLAWEGIKIVALGSIDLIIEGMASMLRAIAKSGDIEFMGERLFGGTVDQANALADSMSKLMTPMDNYAAAAARIINTRDAEIAQIEAITSDMIEYEYAMEESAKATKKTADAAKAAAAPLKTLDTVIGNTEDELKRFAEEAEAAARALNQQLEAYQAFQDNQQALADNYANETALLQMSNKERIVSSELLRFMGQNYEMLAGMSEQAAKAELERAEATIRAGEADLQAAEHIDDLVKQFGRLNSVPLFDLIDSLRDVQKELDALIKKKLLGEAFDPERINELRATLDGLNVEIRDTSIDNMRSFLAALQTVSKEGSEGFRKIGQAMAVLNVAEAALATVSAVSAVLTQGKGEPYSAWARMAAMAAAVAPMLAAIGAALPAFGGGGGGGGGANGAEARQASQGTGTVLGDVSAKSESMLNAMQITADACAQLPGLQRGMLTALQGMQRGISGASAGLARSGFSEIELEGGFGSSLFNSLPGGALSLGGRLLGSIFGGDQDLIDQGLRIQGGSFSNVAANPRASTYQTIETDGGWFGSDDIDDEFEALSQGAITQIQLILRSLGDAVRAGAVALGLDVDAVNSALEAYRIEEIRISTMDLTGEEAQAELEAAFSAIFDGLAGAVAPFIVQFQQVGEGLGETLVRVATSVQVVEEAMFQLGLTLGELDPETMAQVSVALVEAAGGIENFIEGMRSFVDNFAPEAHRFAIAQDELNRALAQVGLTLPETRDGMWELLQSLDPMTEAGAEQIATLLRLAGVSNSYYDMLEQRAEDAEEAARAGRDAVREEIARIAEMRSEAARIFADARSNFAAPRTQRSQAAFDINQSIDQYIAQLQELGDPLGQIVELENLRTDALVRANEALDAQINGFLDDLAFQMNLDGLDELAYALEEINIQYDEYRTRLEQQGATVEQLARLEELRNNALEQATSAIEANTRAQEANTISFAEIDALIESWFQDLLERAKKFFGDGAKSWISEMTGVELRDAPAPMATRSGVLAEFLSSRAAFVTDMNEQLLNFQEQLDNTSWFERGKMAMLEGRIANITRVLQMIGDGAEEAVAYINAIFDQQIGDMLSNLQDEFGTNDPIADINERFDTLIAQAQAWGASLTQLAQIEAFRIIALEQAEEEAFNQQMQWLEQLRLFRDSLLLDSALTTLTPAQRLAEAQSQYNLTRASAAAGDADARGRFEDVARAYLEELRSYYGSSEEYVSGFNQIIGDINEFLGEGGVAQAQTVEALLADIAANTSSQPVDVTPMTEQLITLNETSAEGFVAVVTELRNLKAVTERQEVAQRETTRAINDLANSPRTY